MVRSELTGALLKHMPSQAQLTVDTATAVWWQDSRPTGGHRLSWAGYADFVNCLDLEHWTFYFAKPGIPPWIYLRLDHVLVAPYYLADNKKITSLTVFSSRDAMMINLYGSLEKWIESLQ